MKRITKFYIIAAISLFFTFQAFCGTKQSSQIIKTGHWIYDDLTVLSTESKSTFILETQPVSVGEIRFFLNFIDYDNLSESGKIVYKRVNDYLGDEQDLIKAEEFRFYLNLITEPEFYYKSNKDIDWSFDFNYQDFLLTMPVIIGFSDYFTFQTDFFFGKHAYAASQPDNFTNIPLQGPDIYFYFPSFAYFSGNITFDKWGISSHMGRTGMKVGNTSMGSIVYNNTFETDFYTQLNLYCKYLKYSMDVMEVDNTKFFYLHQLTFRPIKNLNLGIYEGSLLNAPFELRYLNPFNVMHNFGSWREYPGIEHDYYGESNFCAYFGITFEYIPIKNMRIYGLYAQNEMYDPGSEPTPSNLSTPSSIGGQLGIEYNFALPNNSHITTVAEAVYTSPYLYVKHSPDWSLYRNRKHELHSGTDYGTWMGFPEGPDCFAIRTGAEYKSNNKWKAGLHYELTMHGENTKEFLFSQKNKDGFYTYYPSVKFDREGKEDEAVSLATNMWLHGTPEIKNEIIIDGSYRILDNLSLSGQFIYTFVFNNKNTLDNFAQGVELDFAIRYELF